MLPMQLVVPRCALDTRSKVWGRLRDVFHREGTSDSRHVVRAVRDNLEDQLRIWAHLWEGRKQRRGISLCVPWIEELRPDIFSPSSPGWSRTGCTRS